MPKEETVMKCNTCGVGNNEPIYTLDGTDYCAYCLITKLAEKGFLFVRGDSEGNFEVVL